MRIEGKTRRPKDAPKRSVWKAVESSDQSPTQPGHGCCHGLWWIPWSDRGGYIAVAPICSPDALISSAAFCFPMQFFGLCCWFIFKKGTNLAAKRGPTPFFHHFSSSSFSLSLDQRERGRRKDCKDSMPSLRESSSTILAEHSFPSLLFPHFGFIFCNCDLNF